MKRIVSFFVIILVLFSSACSGSGKRQIQFEPAEADALTAEISVREFGTMKFVLYPDKAPKSVENFVKLADDGYYDGVSFAMVARDFCIQCGTPLEGSVVSSFGGYFEDEITEDLLPVRGALCMANLGEKDTNSSQFFIVGQTAEKLAEIDELLAYKGYTLSEYISSGFGTELDDEELAVYFEHGGTPWLYGHNTVFGQLLEGYEVLDEIMNVPTDAREVYTPLEDVVIDHITVQGQK